MLFKYYEVLYRIIRIIFSTVTMMSVGFGRRRPDRPEEVGKKGTLRTGIILISL